MFLLCFVCVAPGVLEVGRSCWNSWSCQRTFSRVTSIPRNTSNSSWPWSIRRSFSRAGYMKRSWKILRTLAFSRAHSKNNEGLILLPWTRWDKSHYSTIESPWIASANLLSLPLKTSGWCSSDGFCSAGKYCTSPAVAYSGKREVNHLARGLLQCIVTSRGNEQSLSKNPIPNGAKSFTSSNKGREFIGPDVTLKLCGNSSWVIVTVGGRKYFWKPWLLILWSYWSRVPVITPYHKPRNNSDVFIILVTHLLLFIFPSPCRPQFIALDKSRSGSLEWIISLSAGNSDYIQVVGAMQKMHCFRCWFT